MSINDLHERAKERAYYMYSNGDKSNNDDRYARALKIEQKLDKVIGDDLTFLKESDIELLTESQINALNVINQKCKKRHNYIVQKLSRYQPTPDTFLRKIFADIPLYINFPLEHINDIANDTHYRNQFETNRSSGTLCRNTRTAWESDLFDSSYNSATDFERPKYGNFPINVDDVNKNHRPYYNAYDYGPSYFVLKNEVKHRTTICQGDSSDQSSNALGNFNYPCDIFHHYESTFQDITTYGHTDGHEYTEIQIHGPIRLDADIESFHYPAGHGYETMYNNAFELLRTKGIEVRSYLSS